MSRRQKPNSDERPPIAIIGMGCRLPGGINSPEQLWPFLLDGGDAIGTVPDGRWDHHAETGPRSAAALRAVTSQGGFLEDAPAFDADFFGISPREAELMDPQQRMMLEVAWEALEHAGIAPASLSGSDTAVYVGVGSDDYGRQMLEDLPTIEAWTGIGASMCAVANRVSYVLDLRGPSMAVDTACSSSLVALHLACQGLRDGESPLALVGGVNLMAGPGLSMVLDAAGAISPDGRSKSFDAAADGYGRGEGLGVLVLKPLAAAQNDGDRVLAVIRGSAVSQDGRTQGIMAPSGAAQEAVVRRALRQGAIDPATVGYVEAHGTGTRMGDPVEVAALSRVFGEGRAPGKPCLIGSIKANIGHLEAGAGVAGVIKAVLALRHGEIPPNAQLIEPNPDIPWAENGLEPVRERTPWPEGDAVRRAGVSGFGYGGTVGHVVLEQAPEPVVGPEIRADVERPRLFVLSGSSEHALGANAAELAGWLRDGEATQEAIAGTLFHRRSHLPWRAGVVASNRAELAVGLERLAAGQPDRSVSTGRVTGVPGGGAVWVFSGHGSQWSGMGRDLLAAEPVFAGKLAALAPVFAEEIGFTPADVLRSGDLERVEVIQPMIFAVQLGLVEVLRSKGLEPAAVIGHSVGEIAAAVTAGVLGPLDGARLVCRRSRLLARVAGAGAMFLVDLPFAETAARLAGVPGVGAAIASSPLSTVVSGDVEATLEIADRWRGEGRMVRRVDSDVAFHSPQMDPLLADLVAAAADLDIGEPVIPLYSTASPDARSGEPRGGHYWAANLRNPVLLDNAVRAAAEDGHRVFLEISAHPVVTHSISETLADHDDVFVSPLLRREQPEMATLLANLAALHCHGVDIGDAGLSRDEPPVELPRNRWHHRRFWREQSAPEGISAGRHDIDSHTLLGSPISVAGASSMRIWQTRLTRDSRPYPGSHPIHGVEVIPAAVLLETFMAAGSRRALTGADLKIPMAVPAADAGHRDVQVVRQGDLIRLASRGQDDGQYEDRHWLTHAEASVPAVSEQITATLDLPGIAARCGEALAPTAVNDLLTAVGVAAVGFDWRIDKILRGTGEMLVHVLPKPLPADVQASAWWASLWDAVLSAVPLVLSGPEILRMPARLDHVLAEGAPEPRVAVHIRRSADDPEGTVDVDIADESGRVLGVLSGLRFATVEGDSGAPVHPRRLVHRLDWTPALPDRAGHARLRTIALVAKDSENLAGLAHTLRRQAAAARLRCLWANEPDDLTALLGELGPDDAVLVLPGESADPGTAAGEDAWRLARTAQVLADGAGALAPRLWAVTAGAREARDRDDLGQATMWGLARVLAGEHPELWAGLADLPATPAAEDLDALTDLLRARPAEPDFFAIRSGELLAARFAAVDGDLPNELPPCRPDGTYLITGGLGSLGVEVATWLAGRGARRILLAGRNGIPHRRDWDGVTDPGTRARIDAVRGLEALGVTVHVRAVDVADLARARRELDTAALGLPPIAGVVHAAGVLDNRMLTDLDEDSLRTVLHPKVRGALVLDELFPPATVDFFVLFSSVGQHLGLTGQASYGASNSFLDALARHRHAAGDTGTLSLAWTSWRGQGMAVNTTVDAELADRGVGDIGVADAFRAWEFATALGDPEVAVFPVTAPGGQVLPILRDLESRDAGQSDVDDFDDLEALPTLSPEELVTFLTEVTCAEVGAELRLPEADLDRNRPLADFGIDSVMALTIRRRLEKRLRVNLPAAVLWTHPTIAAVSAYLAGLLGTPAVVPAQPDPATDPVLVGAAG